jgi:hypothetical protein
MTHNVLECQHCHSEYHYQTSGHGCGGQSQEYCDACFAVVRVALEPVPVKFGKANVNVSAEVTLQELLDEEGRIKEIRHQSNGNSIIAPYMRRVFPEMMEHSGPARTKTREIAYKGKKYILSTWTDNSEPPRMWREAWINLATKEEVTRRRR